MLSGHAVETVFDGRGHRTHAARGPDRIPARVAVCLVLMVVVGAIDPSRARALPSQEERSPQPATLEDAQRLFYSGRFEESAALAQALCMPDIDHLSACELRTSALLFQLRRALREPADRDNAEKDKADNDKAWKACSLCPEVMAAFIADISNGQAVARARLEMRPDDERALFLLGKLDLNFVWLQLGTLGRKTGWHEYWEARHALDRVIAQNPKNVRARVARAWIDYIVDTKMPWGTRWVLGGGDKKRGLLAVRNAAGAETDFFSQAEASFALRDMQLRERDITGAVATARDLARDFPENHELKRFLESHNTPHP